MTEAEQKEENAWRRRFNRFVAEGLSQDEAHELASQMTRRDNDIGDDRRVCFECTHYKDKLCHKILNRWKPTQQLRFILQRCDYFELRGAK
jgi:hypothetical protein